MAFALRVVQASMRMGKAPAERLSARLRWLLRFAEEMADRATRLTQQELEDVNGEVYAFIIEPSPHRGAPHYGRLFRRLSARQVARLAKEVRDGIQAVTSGGGPFTINLRNVRRLIFAKGDGRYFTTYDAADPRSAFLMTMTDLLAQGEVKRCGRVACGRPFAPAKRQAYCSKRCSLLERTRRYRTNTPREEQSEARHQQYVRRYAKKHGISEDKAARIVDRRASRKE